MTQQDWTDFISPIVRKAATDYFQMGLNGQELQHFPDIDRMTDSEVAEQIDSVLDDAAVQWERPMEPAVRETLRLMLDLCTKWYLKGVRAHEH